MKGLTTETMIRWANGTTPGQIAEEFHRRAQVVSGSKYPHFCGTLYGVGDETYTFQEGFAICIGFTAMGEWARRCARRPDTIILDECQRCVRGHR